MSLPKVSVPKFDFNDVIEDFRRLNTNDPGTWPLIPKITILVGLLVVLVAAGWWFVWQDQLATLTQKEQEEVKLREEFLSKKGQAVNLDLYRQQLDEIDRSFGALLKQLPNRSEVEALLVEVNQAGLGRGLQFELFKPSAEVIKDFYAELPITVKITGNYHDFGAFAADVAKLPRIVTLNNISMAPGTGNAAASGKLLMDVQVKTFRYLDEAELNKKRQAAKGGKKK